MSAFEAESEIDWRRIDTNALITFAGVATVREIDADACLQWLHDEGYRSSLLDGSRGFADIGRQFDEMFSWKAQFGYLLADRAPEPPNLDAVRDGFHFGLRESGRHVLRLDHADVLWLADESWVAGLLTIASEHSRLQLALGRRFFCLLVLPDDSQILGATFEELTIPHFGWSSAHGKGRG